MNMRVDSKLIGEVLKYWDDRKTQAMIESLRVEMRRDLRKCSRQEIPLLEDVIERLSDKNFWITLDMVVGYEFTP